uniref:Uncharacterized protein n=1 Tax=Romanomermis culicivorax TaxID=13658 RepID=A0A915HI54_ROMCU
MNQPETRDAREKPSSGSSKKLNRINSNQLDYDDELLTTSNQQEEQTTSVCYIIGGEKCLVIEMEDNSNVKPLFSFQLGGNDKEPWEEPSILPLPPNEALGSYENMDEYIERFNELELTWFFKEDQPVLEYKPYNQGETKCLLWLGAASALAAKSRQEEEVIDFDLGQFHRNYAKEQEAI